MEPINENQYINTNLIYEYTESLFKGINDSLDRLNSKLATVIGFSGVILRFTLDLPGLNSLEDMPCYSCLIFKVLATLAGAIAIILSIIAYSTQKKGLVVSSKELHREWLNREEEECRLRISRTWRDAIEKLETDRRKKARLLDWSLLALAATALFFALDIVLSSIFE